MRWGSPVTSRTGCASWTPAPSWSRGRPTGSSASRNTPARGRSCSGSSTPGGCSAPPLQAGPLLAVVGGHLPGERDEPPAQLPPELVLHLLAPGRPGLGGDRDDHLAARRGLDGHRVRARGDHALELAILPQLADHLVETSFDGPE